MRLLLHGAKVQIDKVMDPRVAVYRAEEGKELTVRVENPQAMDTATRPTIGNIGRISTIESSFQS